MFLRKLKISHKLYLGFGLFSIAMLLVSGYTYINYQKVSQVMDANLAAYQVMQESDGILNGLVTMETSVRGYTITGDEKFLDKFNSGKEAFEVHYKLLKKSVTSELLQMNRLSELHSYYVIWLADEQNVIDAKKCEVSGAADASPTGSAIGAPNNTEAIPAKPDDAPPGNDPAVQESREPGGRDDFDSGDRVKASDLVRTGKGNARMEQMQFVLDEIFREQKRQLEQKRSNLDNIKWKTYITILLSIFITALFAMLIFLLYSLSIMRPIKMLIRATENITKQNYQNPIKLESDVDLGKLVRNFNAMQIAIQEREEELKKKNEAIRAKMIEVDEANRLKSQFLANISHELRTPLNSIIGFTTRVIKKNVEILPPSQLENLKIVKSEGDHLLALINDLLDYSKLEAGRMKVYPEYFNLADVIGEAYSITKPMMEGKPLTYEQDNNADEYIGITSDRLRVKQILINLFSNAIKYSEQGKIKCSVSKLETDYCIAISDEGIGIAEENLTSIFDEFRQVDGTYTRKAGGTGLGLSITKGLTEILGGRIEVESTPGIGSCFSVYLPYTVLGMEEREEPIENENVEVYGVNEDLP